MKKNLFSLMLLSIMSITFAYGQTTETSSKQLPPEAASDTIGILAVGQRTYHVSVGAIDKNEEGLTRVEAKGNLEGKDSPFWTSGGYSIMSPLGMSIVAGGKAYEAVGTKQSPKELRFIFNTTKTPVQVIIYGIDREGNELKVTFDAKTKKVIK